MKKILVIFLAVALIAFTGCNNKEVASKPCDSDAVASDIIASVNSESEVQMKRLFYYMNKKASGHFTQADRDSCLVIGARAQANADICQKVKENYLKSFKQKTGN